MHFQWKSCSFIRKLVDSKMLKISIPYSIIKHINMAHTHTHSVGQEITMIHLAKLFHIKVSSKSINYRAILQHWYKSGTDRDLIAGAGELHVSHTHKHIHRQIHMHTQSVLISYSSLTLAPGTPVLWSGWIEGKNRSWLVTGSHTNNPWGLHNISQKPRKSIHADNQLYFP